MITLRDLIAAYPTVSWSDHLHLLIRWHVCPMCQISGHLPSEGLIIDLGCGHGLFTQLAARQMPERTVIGIDLDARKIAVARQLSFSNLNFLTRKTATIDVFRLLGVKN